MRYQVNYLILCLLGNNANNGNSNVVVTIFYGLYDAT